ncbi:hypothetical protein [Bacillus arachidis]|uniref:hypothetical protein n=1 Tax=Bacillus arachidis TaxID=2819290 RepID=UPI001AA0617D|nr:hypothetical protein [Bacillus arachidis]
MSNMTKEELMRELSEKHGITEFKSESRKQRDMKYMERKILQDDKRFSWQDTINQVAIKNQLSDIQKGALLIMSTFLEFNGDGKLFDTKGGKLTVNKLAPLIRRDTRTAKRIVTECENIGALTTHKEGKETIITFTDMLYKCGETLKGTAERFVKVYKLSVRELVGKFTLKEIGFLSDLLPHFHWKTHILCENPTEMDSNKIKVWRRKDIIEKLRYNKDFVYETMNKFKRNLVTIEISSAIDLICLSPNLVSRQEYKVTLEKIEEVAHSIADNPQGISYL